jgi:hypothetical protein
VARPDEQREVDGDTGAGQQTADRGMAKAHQPEAGEEIRGRAGGDQREVEKAVERAGKIVRQQDDAEARISRVCGAAQ